MTEEADEMGFEEGFESASEEAEGVEQPVLFGALLFLLCFPFVALFLVADMGSRISGSPVMTRMTSGTGYG